MPKVMAYEAVADSLLMNASDGEQVELLSCSHQALALSHTTFCPVEVLGVCPAQHSSTGRCKRPLGANGCRVGQRRSDQAFSAFLSYGPHQLMSKLLWHAKKYIFFADLKIKRHNFD